MFTSYAWNLMFNDCYVSLDQSFDKSYNWYQKPGSPEILHYMLLTKLNKPVDHCILIFGCVYNIR